MICPNCQSDNPDAASFCMACGHALRQSHSVVAGHQVAGGIGPKELERFIPRELADKLDMARRRGAMEGERRIVTMLFCDVKGSTAAAEQMDPEEWLEIINGAFEHMIKPVYRYEGIVARLMGDAILAFFGAPIAHEDDPQRAVSAGLDIVAGIASYRRELAKKRQIDLDVRVGINTGLVVVGAVGSDMRMEYTAIGDAINLAARMERLAQPGSVQIAESTYKLVAPLFDFEDLGGVDIEGKRELVRAYRVLWRKAEPGRMRGLEDLGIGSPLVGRRAEMDLLESAVSRLRAGQGGAIAVIGEAGLGKSRLIEELRRDQAGTGEPALTWLTGHTLTFGQAISYWPFQEILWQYAGIHEEDSEEQAWKKLELAVEDLFAEESREILPYLASLLSLEVKSDYAERVRFLDAEAISRQIFLTVRRYFDRLSGRQPLVLVFEDLHWMDDSSARLLQHLLPLVSTTALLLIGVSRPEPDTPGAEFRRGASASFPDRYFEIVLTPLSDADGTTLVRNLLEIEDLPERVRALILQKSEGNPYFLEEVIRTLVSTGTVVRNPATGTWQATTEIETIDVPDTIQGVIMARVDRLSEEVKQVLRAAAVIGQSFLYQVLRSVLEAEQELDQHLARLQTVELIREKQRLPDLEYIFKHALAQEATYQSILLQRRRELHASVGAVIERLFGNRLEEFYSLLAHHYARAEKWERAQEFLFKAGDQAGRVAADAEALIHYRQALLAYQRAFGDQLNPAQRVALERRMGEALYRRGEHAQALEYLRRALAYLGHPLPASRMDIRRAILGQIARQVGHRLLPGIFLKPVSETADPAGEEENLILEAVMWIGIVSDPELFMLCSLRGLNHAEQTGSLKWRAQGYLGLQTICDFLGFYGLGGRYGRLGMAVAEQSGHPTAAGYAHQGLTMHESWLDRGEAALSYGRRGAQIYHQIGFLRGWGAASMLTAETLVYLGRFAEARQLAEQLLRVGQDGADLQVWAWGLSVLAPVQQFSGQLEDAITTFEKYFRFAEELSDSVSMVEAKTQLARCYLALDELEAALETIAESQRLCRKHNVRGRRFVSRIPIAWAAIYLYAAEHRGQEERSEWLQQARKACRRARKLARSYRPWLDQAYRLQGTCEWLQGRPAAAQKWWQRSLRYAQTAGHRYEMGMTLLESGRRLDNADDLAQAEAILTEVGALHSRRDEEEALGAAVAMEH